MLDFAKVGRCLGWSIPLPQRKAVIEHTPQLLVARPEQDRGYAPVSSHEEEMNR